MLCDYSFPQVCSTQQWRAGNKCEFSKCGLSRRMSPNLQMFRFPPDSERAQKWILNSGNTSLAFLSPEQLKRKAVCDRHFRQTDFISKGRLKKTAIPRPFHEFEPIFLDHVDSSWNSVEKTINENISSTARYIPDLDSNINTIQSTHRSSDGSLEVTMPETLYMQNVLSPRMITCITCLDDCVGHSYKVISAVPNLEVPYRDLIIQLVPEMADLLKDSDVICYGCSNILNLCGLFIRKCSYVQVETKEKNKSSFKVQGVQVDTSYMHENTDNIVESGLSFIKIEDSNETESSSESDIHENAEETLYSRGNRRYVEWFQNLNILTSLPDKAVCHNRIISVKQPNTETFDKFRDNLSAVGIFFSDLSMNPNGNTQKKRIILLGNKFDNCIKCKECHRTLKNSASAYKHCLQHRKRRELNETRKKLMMQRMENKKLAELKAKKKFICLTCLACFPSREDLNKHDEVHAPWVCKICGKVFEQRLLWKEHNRIHDPTIRYICEFCGRGFKTAGCLRQHLRIHRKMTFLCSKCPKVFNTNAILKRHYQSHDPPKLLGCNECGVRCSSNAALNTHRRLVHLKNGKKKCFICGEVFVRGDYLRRHIKRHTRTDADRITTSSRGSYKCKMCSKVFKNLQYLKAHLVIHYSMKPYKCKYCGLSFTLKSNQNRHERKHENDPIGFQNKCPVCWKLCKNKEDVLQHVSSHPTPYKCKSCDLSYARKYLLSHHVTQAHVDPAVEYKNYQSLLRESLMQTES